MDGSVCAAKHEEQNYAAGVMSLNGLQLPEGGDFGVLHCQPSTNFDRSTKLDLTTEPPLLGRCCYSTYLFFFRSQKV
ncbi:MAG: hypothetical protein LC115_07120 [Bacteroidia bacterium]|nr:hypothetical protein [Bacteroidia bacterium]